jgi:hypothetical protein
MPSRLASVHPEPFLPADTDRVNLTVCIPNGERPPCAGLIGGDDGAGVVDPVGWCFDHFPDPHCAGLLLRPHELILADSVLCGGLAYADPGGRRVGSGPAPRKNTPGVWRYAARGTGPAADPSVTMSDGIGCLCGPGLSFPRAMGRGRSVVNRH